MHEGVKYIWRQCDHQATSKGYSWARPFRSLYNHYKSWAKPFKCLSAIESLSKIGGWKGDIYFLIGNTKCLTDDAIESLETQNVHIIPIHEEHGYGILPNRNNNERKMEIKFDAWKYIAKLNPKTNIWETFWLVEIVPV